MSKGKLMRDGRSMKGESSRAMMILVGQNMYGEMVIEEEDTLKEASAKKEAIQEMEKSIDFLKNILLSLYTSIYTSVQIVRKS